MPPVTHLSAGGPELPLEKFEFHLNADSWEQLERKRGIRDPFPQLCNVITAGYCEGKEPIKHTRENQAQAKFT